MPFREIAESTYDWESWISPQGHPLWINRAVERVTGYSVEECMEHPEYPLFLVHPEDREAFETVLLDAKQGGSGNHYEFRILGRDDTVRWGAISWQPLLTDDGAERGYRSSVRDITDRKHMEAELRRAVTRAEEASRAKTEFLANVSHELRTPLQSILGYGELLVQKSGAEAQGDYAARIVEQARWLNQLVGDLLDFSSLQTGEVKLSIERFAPDELIERLLHGFWPLFKKKGVSLSWETSPGSFVSCDPKRITQIVNNLVGNALKFTESGEVRVRSEPDPEAALWRVIVDDTGPGVDDAEELFSPFRQGAENSGGVGLGLAISRHLARRLGGDVVCERSPLGGARFVVGVRTDFEASETMPQLEGERSGGPWHADEPQAPLEVLIVDDSDPAREFLQEALAGFACSCRSAASAHEAYELADALCPDLILVDIQMPDVDGWSAASNLRVRLGEAPLIVAMSASGLADNAVRLKQAGFNAFSAKPLHLADLRELIQRARVHRDSSVSAVFDPERWRELRSIRTQEGETLLERMQRRVVESLPPVHEELEALRLCADQAAVAQALHQAAGLFALIGARAGHQAAIAAEAAADHEELLAEDPRLLRCLSHIEEVLAELQGQLGAA